jgi:hypothetical protein
MAKKTVKVIVTPKDLAKAIRTAPENLVRKCLLAIAQNLLLDTDQDNDEYLNPDKEQDGADFIQLVSEHLEAYGFWPGAGEVECSICGKTCSAGVAHLHQGKYIGHCCWDPRLKASE